jgi:hypothetical protein
LATVVLSSASGNTYNEEDGNGYLLPGSTKAADLKTGSTNTSGGAFGFASTTGNDPSNPGHNHTLANFVELEAGAVLGGTGIASQQIVADGPTSTITAGDPGQASLSLAPSLGTLHLAGGVSAPSGLTLSFKISADGLSNDKLDLGAGAFSLSGPITVDFTSLGTVLPGTTYILATGTGAWSDTGATFSSTSRPDGLFLESFDFNPALGADSFSVEFKVAPEPSTWMLMGLGVLALVWRVRRTKATV